MPNRVPPLPNVSPLVLLVAVLLGTAPRAGATELSVEQNGSGEFTTIQAAIDAAADGDTVTVGPGSYSESLLIDVKWVVLQSRTGREDTILQNAHTGRAIDIRRSGNPVQVIGITFLQNRAGSLEFPNNAGGAIQALASPLAVRDCAFTENLATAVGGSIYCRAGFVPGIGNPRPADDPASVRLLIEDCVFSGNFAGDEGGGAFSDETPVTVTGSVFENNDAVGGGGVSVLSASLLVSDCAFLDNSVAVFGGGINISGVGPVVVTGSEFRENRSEGTGGGIRTHDVTSVTVADCVFTDNVAAHEGGGFYGRFSALTLESTLFAGGSANQGGGFYLKSSESSTVNRCSFIDNTAPSGASFEIEQTSVVFTGNLLADASPAAATCRFGASIGGSCNAGVSGAGGCLTLDEEITVARCPGHPDLFCAPPQTEGCGVFGHTELACPASEECQETPVKASTWGALKRRY